MHLVKTRRREKRRLVDASHSIRHKHVFACLSDFSSRSVSILYGVYAALVGLVGNRAGYWWWEGLHYTCLSRLIHLEPSHPYSSTEVRLQETLPKAKTREQREHAGVEVSKMRKCRLGKRNNRDCESWGKWKPRSELLYAQEGSEHIHA